MGKVVVEVVRGGRVESRHQVDACVADATGTAELAARGSAGCSLPAFVLPLRALALAASRLATVARPALGPIGRAMRAHPELVAGTGRLCTVLMGAAPEIIAKTGAEGVFLA